MGPEVRQSDFDVRFAEVRDRLRTEPWSFDFFQAVRLLERMMPERARVGDYAQPASEVARFSANPSLAFPASQIQELDWDDNKQARIRVNFMGLVGPLGVLPDYYTELVAVRARAHDTAVRDFFDLFHHRILSLFYQAWEKHHFAIGYERDQHDVFFGCLLSLIGLGTSALQQRQPVRDEAFAFYAGLLAMQTKPALALRGILADYFRVGVEVEPFVGVWRRLEETNQCRLEDDPYDETGLGAGVVVGDELWDQHSRVRIKLGPLTIEEYEDFLPGGAAHEPLRSLLRMFSDEFEYEVQLTLRKEAVPLCSLGGAGGSLRLGWTTWMKSRPGFDRDPADTVLLLT